MQIPPVPRKAINSVSLALKEKEVWATIPLEWQLYFNSIMQPFETVDVHVFLKNPDTVFADAYQSAGFQPLQPNELHQVAQYIASLIVSSATNSANSSQQGSTATVIKESSLDPTQRLPHNFVKDFSLALERLGSYALHNTVLPQMSLEGNNSSNEVIAEYILVNGLFEAFVHACVATQPTNWPSAKRFVPIKWSDGSFSKWSARSLEQRLQGWSLDDLYVLTGRLDVTKDIVGRADTASLYAGNLISYCTTKHWLTMILEAAAEMQPTPLHW